MSSDRSDFSCDYNVSGTPEQLHAGKGAYNFQDWKVAVSDDQGISDFCKNERDEVFHTYSCYSRGIDMVSGVYHSSTLCPRAAMGTASNSRWSGYAGRISIESTLLRDTRTPGNRA